MNFFFGTKDQCKAVKEISLIWLKSNIHFYRWYKVLLKDTYFRGLKMFTVPQKPGIVLQKFERIDVPYVSYCFCPSPLYLLCRVAHHLQIMK